MGYRAGCGEVAEDLANCRPVLGHASRAYDDLSRVRYLTHVNYADPAFPSRASWRACPLVLVPLLAASAAAC